MISDGRKVSDKFLDADLCIIGGGAAGITIANRLLNSGLRILLIESGGAEAEAETEDLNNAATVSGEPYPLPGSRLRFLGGTTNHWSGHCYRFIDRDFAAKPGVAGSGWPIGLNDVTPYYDEAGRLALFRAQTIDWNTDHWRKKLGTQAWQIDPKIFTTRLTVVSPTDPETGLRSFAAYLDPLRKSRNVHIVHNANVTELTTNSGGTTVERVQVKTLSGQAFTVTAKRFVLACGGVENARVLLASNSVKATGMGNDHDLVGRYFADHIVVTQRFVRNPSLPPDALMAFQDHDPRTRTVAHFHLSDEVIAREQMDDVFLRVTPQYALQTPAVVAAQRVQKQLAGGRFAIKGEDLSAILGNVSAVGGWAAERSYCRADPIVYTVAARVEPPPSADSRITLTANRDKLGMPIANLHWAINDSAKYSLRRALDIFAGVVGAGNLGRMQITFDPKAPWPRPYDIGYHHTCTTRMGSDPQSAVVDADCRVFGVDNLYVIGSSVFPSAGSGSPTMMITALSLRLADHLKGVA